MAGMVGICRLCATLRKVELLTYITEDNHEVCEKLKTCCQLDFSVDNLLPKCVCVECLRELRTAYAFCQKVREAQETLQSLFLTDATTKRSPTETLTAVTSNWLPQRESKRLNVTNSNAEERAKKLLKKLPCVEICPEEELITGCENNLQSTYSSKEGNFVDVYEIINSNHSDCDYREMQIFQQTYDDRQSCDTTSSQLDKLDFMGRCTDNQNTEDKEEPEHKQFAAQELLESQNLATVNSVEQEDLYVVEIQSDKEEYQMEEHLEEEPIYDKQIEENTACILSVVDWNVFEWCCYLCSYSNKSFDNLTEHALHEHNIHIEELQYKCRECQKICMRYHTFINHVRMRHHLGLALRCDACNERFDSCKLLEAHRAEKCVNAVKFPKLVLCYVCGKSFHSHSSVQLHVRTQHGPVKKSHSCKECGRQFRRSSSLRVHEKVHTSVKNYTCEFCGRPFRQKVNLDVHMYSHESAKSFECGVCHKNFKTPASLEKHIQLHSGVKNFKCDHCDSRFRTKDAKLSHERTHTGELPFQCQYCDKRFRFRSTLMTHLNVHTGKRPYACEVCNRTFTNWSNFNKHMKRRHSKDATNKKASTTSSKKSAAALNEILIRHVDDEEDDAIKADEKSSFQEIIEISPAQTLEFGGIVE